MTEFGFIKVTVQGLNGAGSITATGLKVGDRLLLGYSPNNSGLEQIVSVNDQIQQLTTLNWSGVAPFDLILLRGI